MRTFIVLATCVAALTLAACGDKADETASVEAGAASAPAAAPTVDAPRPGLWRVTTSMAGLPAGVAMPSVETCVTGQSFAQMQKDAARMPADIDCTDQTFRREGDVLIGHAVCTLPDGSKSETDTRVSGDFNSRYTMEVKSRMTPAPSPDMAETTMTMTAERIGDCPAVAG